MSNDKQVSLRELINPSGKQEDFLKATDNFKYVLYGGAKGGGKSYILRWALVRKLLKWAKQGHIGVRVGLFCEDYPALKDRQITKIQKEFPTWLGKLSENNIEGMSFRLNPEFGSGIIALRNLDEISKYASSEFAIAAVDELTKNKREVFDQFRSIIRWPGIEDVGFWGGTNPGEIGHAWVKKLWIDKDFSPEDPKPDQLVFIKSLPTDNPHNANSYLNELRSLPEKLRKAYYDGNWNIFEGQYFAEWDDSVHVMKAFPVPIGWKRFRCYDHGRANFACCKWYAVDYDGRVWVYKELYVKGLDVDEIAFRINEFSHNSDCYLIQELRRLKNATDQEKPFIIDAFKQGTVMCSHLIECEDYQYNLADPAIFSNIGFTDKFGGQTIAETFARYGITFMPASNRRVDGWNLMHQYLNTENKVPKLIYFDNCINSIRTIPTLVHDKYKPEDLDTDGEDHAADVDRYLLMSLHEQKTAPPMNSVQKRLEEMTKPRPNFRLTDI